MLLNFEQLLNKYISNNHFINFDSITDNKTERKNSL
jgi:regulator of sigma D